MNPNNHTQLLTVRCSQPYTRKYTNTHKFGCQQITHSRYCWQGSLLAKFLFHMRLLVMSTCCLHMYLGCECAFGRHRCVSTVDIRHPVRTQMGHVCALMVVHLDAKYRHEQIRVHTRTCAHMYINMCTHTHIRTRLHK